MAIPESFLNELTERSDIVDVVSGYVRLTKKSGSNLFGLCPFHSEKTPSFSVSPDRQIYHCFGCGKGGGVINFIMEIENLSFPEAVEFLARRAGMRVPEETEDRESRRRSRTLALNRDAARFFYEQLSSPGAQRARDYVQRRGIGSATAVNFGLGYAPDSWDSLEKAMKQKGYTEQELFDAGLVRSGRKSGSFYDTFRDRLMFPVIDVRGNVIGFSGRVLGDGEPKYMNSPETAVFNKSRNLFALNLAKKSKSGYIVLVEGNIDVVSMHQAGFDSAVASLGTSLTPEQARLLSRYTDQVVIAYDSDEAGRKASQRAIGILEKLDLKVKVLSLPGAKDPDEFIRSRGAAAFRNLLEGAEDQLDYRLRAVVDRYDLNEDAQKVAFLRDAADLVARLPGSAEREVYARRTAALAGVTAEAVLAEVAQRRRMLLRRAGKDEEKKQTRRAAQTPGAGGKRYEDEASARAEEGLIRTLLLDPELVRGRSLPPSSDFSDPTLGHIYEVVLERLRSGAETTPAALAAELSGDEMSLLVRLENEPLSAANGARALEDYIRKLQECRELKRRPESPEDWEAYRRTLKERKGYRET